MNVQSVDNANTWPDFVKLASAARVRNAGFELPVGGIKAAAMQQGASINPANRLYGSQPPQNGQQFLGTRFDAYA